MISTGESGINPISKEEYFRECMPDVLAGIFCTYFGVPEPNLRKNPSLAPKSWRGHYCPSTGTVSYSDEYTGLIMHELAHHIVHKIGKNGSGHHNPQFWDILQQMHNYWR